MDGRTLAKDLTSDLGWDTRPEDGDGDTLVVDNDVVNGKALDRNTPKATPASEAVHVPERSGARISERSEVSSSPFFFFLFGEIDDEGVRQPWKDQTQHGSVRQLNTGLMACSLNNENEKDNSAPGGQVKCDSTSFVAVVLTRPESPWRKLMNVYVIRRGKEAIATIIRFSTSHESVA